MLNMIMPKDVQKIWKEFRKEQFPNWEKFCDRLVKELNFVVIKSYYEIDYLGDINNVTKIKRRNYYIYVDYNGIDMYYNFGKDRR